tara:strand:- start:1822 stop:2796 length:975 start_codon:yes stop_codon:yes gene_type:complete
MANIISTSLKWSQEDAAKYFLQPLFVSNNDMQYFDVISNISGEKILLDKYAALSNITKTLHASDCFAEEATQAANSQVTLELDRLEVEHKQKAHSLYNHIKSQLLRTGVNRMDLSGTVLMEMISEILIGGIKRDFSTIFWWGMKTGGAASSPQVLSDGVWTAVNGIPAGQVVAATASPIADLASLMTARTNELAASEQVMFVSRAFAEAYRAELQQTVVGAAYNDLQNGIENLSYNGIPMIVKPDWDVNIATYGGSMPSQGPSADTATKAAMLMAKGAIAVGTDWDIQDVDMWYNKDCKENRFRMSYSFGCALKDNSLVATIVG